MTGWATGGGPRRPPSGAGPAGRATVATGRPAGRKLAGTLAALAVAVQALVWGPAPGSRHGGSLLPGLRPAFGVGYAAGLLAAALLLCAYQGLRDGALVVLVAAALVDLVFWCAHLAGLQFPLGAAAALTAGFGVLSLGAGLLGGWVGGAGGRSRRAPPGGRSGAAGQAGGGRSR